MSILFALLKFYDVQKNNYVMQSSQGYGFPVSDSYTHEEKDKSIIIVNVLGLLGVNSPLPSYLIDSQNNSWNNLINLLNNRFYKLFYFLWKQHHPIHQENKNDCYKKIMASLIGKEDGALFPFSRYFFRKNCCGYDLAVMVKILIPGSEVIVKQNIPVWRNVRLDRGCNQLGDNVMLGTESFDVASRIRVTIIMKDIALAKELILRQSIYRELYCLMSAFAQSFFSFDLVLRSFVNQENLLSLGEEAIYLCGLDVLGVIRSQWHSYFLSLAYDSVGK